jgi:predicted transposase/invertase (TIGR01784 family)
VEDMLKLSELKQTRVYQEALEEGRQEGRQEGVKEGKLAAVPLLLKAGMSVEEIAQQLEVEIEAVRQIAQQQSIG